MDGGFSWILIALLAAALVVAAIGDWRSRIIPNWLNGAIALLAIPFWWASGLSVWPDMAMQLGLGLFVLLFFAAVFQFGGMGGGDVKLLAALALWLPAGALLKLLVIMSLAGGVLTIALLIPHRLAKNEANPEIPYGIAISFAGMWLIGERILNQFV
jgi:prepilin peptidase CpaA